MKPSFRNLGAIGGLLAVMVLTISACDQEAKKKPPLPPAQIKSPPIKIAQQKPEPKRKVPVEQEPPPEPAPKRQAAVPVPAPVVPDEPVAKSPDKASSKAVELGRASITQADEPAIRTPDLRGWDPLAADCAWYREFKRDVSADRADPHSDQMLSRLLKGKGHIDAQWSGSWTPAGWNWYSVPFQVVSGKTEPISIPGTWAYGPASNGPYLLPPEPVAYENSKETIYATAKWTKGGDHHLLIYVRDEDTGGLKELWEYYQPWVTRNDKGQITAVAGASWRKFDLRKGETPAPGVLATDAAGLMITPLLVRYDEVARGSINHALRFCVNNNDISPTFKWPARTAAGAYNRETGMPYGTRLRIKSSWWDANADAFLGTGTQARIIGEALRRYGCILADGSNGTTIQLCGVADQRWEAKLHARLNAIPVSALEVIDTPPLLEIKGPKTLDVGQLGSWTLSCRPDESPVGAGTNVNLYDQKGKLLKYRFAVIDADHRTVTVEHRFSEPGVYVIKPYHEWNTGFGPYRITVGNTSP
jgi:hypothetical protein